ncbi:MAG: hypothetical protein ACJAY7_001550 [Pseudohongiellaceae bacterium]|jgi:hypothetical protein
MEEVEAGAGGSILREFPTLGVKGDCCLPTAA